MVRIWCVPVEKLDRQHLLGEHLENHIIASTILRGKGGYYNHPETNRFKKHLGMLVKRHSEQVVEMEKRGYKHKSPLIITDYRWQLGEYDEPYTYNSEEMERDLKVLEERQSGR